MMKWSTEYMEKLTSCEQALAMLFEKWMPAMGTELVPVAQALGRTAAREYAALHSIPVVRASAMDGVAVDSARFADGMPDTSDWKRGTDYVRADTGDDFDDRFDAVIRIEDVTILPSGGLAIKEGVSVTSGMGVHGAGSSFRAGARLNDKELPLRPSDLAALAMGGVTEVEVWKKPCVAFIPTGSELIPVGAPLRRGCNYDTNSLLVSLTLEQMGAQPICYPIVPDDPELLRKALYRALAEADLVIINGGSSKGSEDFNTRLLSGEGEFLFHGVAAAPGRPLSMAVVRGTPVINMAGPALAAFYTLEWCIRPIVCRCLHRPVPTGCTIRGKLTRPLRGGAPLNLLSRVEVCRTKDGYTVTPFGRGEADLPSMLRTNAMLILPAGGSGYAAGDEIEVTLLRDPAEIPREG